MLKPVILIGGTAGTGKSTLARELSSHFAIDHRIGTGFIREILKSQHSEETAPELYRFTFRAERPIDNLIAQAERLRPAVTACITRAKNEGTSLVIEGNHLLPALYRDAQVDIFIVLSAPAPDEHFRRLHGLSHSKRQTTTLDFENVRRIAVWLQTEADRCGIPSMLYADNLASFVDALDRVARNGRAV